MRFSAVFGACCSAPKTLNTQQPAPNNTSDHQAAKPIAPPQHRPMNAPSFQRVSLNKVESVDLEPDELSAGFSFNYADSDTENSGSINAASAGSVQANAGQALESISNNSFNLADRGNAVLKTNFFTAQSSAIAFELPLTSLDEKIQQANGIKPGDSIQIHFSPHERSIRVRQIRDQAIIKTYSKASPFEFPIGFKIANMISKNLNPASKSSLSALDNLLKPAVQALNELASHCICCDKPLANQVLRPMPCVAPADNQFTSQQTNCEIIYDQFNFGVDLQRIIEQPDLFNLVKALIQASARTNPQRLALIFDNKWPSCIQQNQPAHNKAQQLATILNQIPNANKLPTTTGALETSLLAISKETLECARWVLARDRNIITKLPAEQCLKGYGTNEQYLINYGLPDRETAFKDIAPESTKLTTYHGSNLGNWFGILQKGLVNASNSQYQTNGASCGAGVYSAKQFNMALGYTAGDTTAIVAVCETKADDVRVNKPSFVVSKNQTSIIPRVLLINPKVSAGQQPNPMDLQAIISNTSIGAFQATTLNKLNSLLDTLSVASPQPLSAANQNTLQKIISQARQLLPVVQTFAPDIANAARIQLDSLEIDTTQALLETLLKQNDQTPVEQFIAVSQLLISLGQENSFFKEIKHFDQRLCTLFNAAAVDIESVKSASSLAQLSSQPWQDSLKRMSATSEQLTNNLSQLYAAKSQYFDGCLLLPLVNSLQPKWHALNNSLESIDVRNTLKAIDLSMQKFELSQASTLTQQLRMKLEAQTTATVNQHNSLLSLVNSIVQAQLDHQGDIHTPNSKAILSLENAINRLTALKHQLNQPQAAQHLQLKPKNLSLLQAEQANDWDQYSQNLLAHPRSALRFAFETLLLALESEKPLAQLQANQLKAEEHNWPARAVIAKRVSTHEFDNIHYLYSPSALAAVNSAHAAVNSAHAVSNTNASCILARSDKVLQSQPYTQVPRLAFHKDTTATIADFVNIFAKALDGAQSDDDFIELLTKGIRSTDACAGARQETLYNYLTTTGAIENFDYLADIKPGMTEQDQCFEHLRVFKLKTSSQVATELKLDMRKDIRAIENSNAWEGQYSVAKFSHYLNAQINHNIPPANISQLVSQCETLGLIG